MIGMVISASEGGKLPIEGYNVRIDGVKKNDALLTDTQFTYDFGVKDNDTHRINVDVTYTVVGEKKGTQYSLRLICWMVSKMPKWH